MDAQTCLKKLQCVGTLQFATIGLDGTPQVRCISAIHYKENSFYFYTARGKNFCQELLSNGNVQILAYTRFKEMIRVSTKAFCIPDTEQKTYIDLIFQEQPYLINVYPDNTREIGIIFGVTDMEIEYFNLGVKPIFRETYIIGTTTAHEKGYVITNKCISCGICAKNCPQRCIEIGKPYKIRQNNCLHCGNCFEKCPVNAIKHR